MPHNSFARDPRACSRSERVIITMCLSLTVACSPSETATPPAATTPSGASLTDVAPGDSSAAPSFTLPAEQLRRLHVVPVTLSTYRVTVQTTGTVAFDADISTQVLAPMSGPVTSILAQPGAYVRRGDPLAIVASPDFAAAVAGFRKAQTMALQARRVADLNEKLFKTDALARRDLEQSQAEALAAEADVEAAMQQLRALGVDDAAIATIRDSQTAPNIQGAVRTPIDGTVVDRLITPGQLLEAGATACFAVANLDTMWVMASVFEADLARVQAGDRASIISGASPTPVSGLVTYVAAQVDAATKATSVRIVVPNALRLLKKDMYVQVAINSGKQQRGLLVPVSAVLRDEDNLPFLFVEVPARGGAAGAAAATAGFARRRITIGSRVGDQYEITSGLKDGERIIAEGALFLQFAQGQ